MVNMGASYMVNKVKLTYIPGEQWKDNFIRGFDVYVTDFEYPFQPAADPKGTAGDGDLFVVDEAGITASIPYPDVKEVAVVAFEPTRGRYNWIVSNSESSDWWELHGFTAYATKIDETSVRELKTPGFAIYPNPVSSNGKLTINIEKGLWGDLMINDLTGRIVYRNSNFPEFSDTFCSIDWVVFERSIRRFMFSTS